MQIGPQLEFEVQILASVLKKLIEFSTTRDFQLSKVHKPIAISLLMQKLNKSKAISTMCSCEEKCEEKTIKHNFM